ncbi:4-aminobutyrate--2-oxoglutarate transaminase [Blastococcus xanthinilyticus]|uniref:(S)-3-amino-2-methylpropionate transaminase n=1 Tax=Blastococcus xanthinilyticus TaxID=1564164 RepID=A0A5S5CZT8_9ACTN|nr:4-aminobutyrate--2-oxoglutarate transaminase [Blastococcus xanthinilyticus]TYP88594.1 4-aminobutyrate aminotransferase/(S)-3-amino-2-methylpropionate transaminase [Blastococcus xanthinilyticus]
MSVVEAPAAGGPQLEQVRRLVTAIPGPRSLELAARRAQALPAGIVSGQPVFAAAAGGGVLVDVDGNSFIDFGSGIAVTSVGNSASRVVERAVEQLRQFTHTCFLVNPYEGYVEVCEALNRLTPGDHVKRTALFNSGAEAVENAVKYARAATGRPGVVVFDHAYHGRTLLTMAMTAKNNPYKKDFGPFTAEVHRAPMAYPFRAPGGRERAAEQAMAALRDLVDVQVGADQIACVVIEPIQGEGGFIVPPEGFLPAVAEFCRERGILFVADEVQTGFARTGDMFASEHEGLAPDLITTAKGLAGGLPLAAVTGRAEIMDAVHPGGIGGTYSGNPAACAAALGVIETIEAEGLVERARVIGDRFLARLTGIADGNPVIGDVRGRGAMIAVELVRPGTTEPDPAAVAQVIRYCQERGLLVLSAGTYGNVLRFLPPLVMPEHLLAEGLDILTEAFATL